MVDGILSTSWMLFGMPAWPLATALGAWLAGFAAACGGLWRLQRRGVEVSYGDVLWAGGVAGLGAAAWVASSGLCGIAEGAAWPLAGGSVAMGLCVTAAVTDLRARIIPNEVVALGALASVAALPWSGAAVVHVATAAGVAAGLAALRAVGRRAYGADVLGGGDVKLAAVLALALGPLSLSVLYAGVVLAAGVGVAGLATGRHGRRTRLPLAPFIGLGLAAVAFGYGPVALSADVLY